MLKIDTMTDNDIDFAIAQTTREKWGNIPDDFRRLLHLEPEGCFIARENDIPVGMVSSTTYGDYAFLGSLIVGPDYRHRGLGTTLMKHVLDYLRRRQITCIELDGSLPAVPIYRRLGFKDKYLSFRFFRPPGKSERNNDPPGILPPVEDLIACDISLTGLDRKRLLERFFTEFGKTLYSAGSGKLRGYSFVRDRQGGAKSIGPLVADNTDIANKLMARMVALHENSPLSIGVPETNRDSVRLIREYGFLYNEPSLRMYLGEKREYEKHIFGIASPEKG